MVQAPEPATEPRALSPAWQEALRTRTNVPPAAATTAAAPASRRRENVSRRRFLAGSFWSGLGATLLATTGGLLDFIYPRGVTGFGGPVAAGNVADYPPGAAPTHNVNGHFWIVNLDPTEASPNGSGGGEGLLALWRKCPHLGCSVPWNRSFVLPGFEAQGGFRCPCHGSTYTKAGVRVHGPAERSMDTMRVEVSETGEITVHTDEITSGALDNPGRALPV